MQIKHSSSLCVRAVDSGEYHEHFRNWSQWGKVFSSHSCKEVKQVVAFGPTFPGLPSMASTWNVPSCCLYGPLKYSEIPTAWDANNITVSNHTFWTTLARDPVCQKSRQEFWCPWVWDGLYTMAPTLSTAMGRQHTSHMGNAKCGRKARHEDEGSTNLVTGDKKAADRVLPPHPTSLLGLTWEDSLGTSECENLRVLAWPGCKCEWPDFSLPTSPETTLKHYKESKANLQLVDK